MSIDVKDHRKFLEGKLKESEAKKIAESQLLPQLHSDGLPYTGDEKLDKLIRAVHALLTKHEEGAKQAALIGIGAVQEDMIRLKQFEYFYNKGHEDAFKAVINIPSQIMREAKAAVPEGTTIH